MTAQEKYIASLLLVFSTFLESHGVSKDLALQTTQKFIEFINKQKSKDSNWSKNWSINELEKFLSSQNIAHKSVVLLKKFVYEYTPFEVDVYLHEFLASLKNDNRSNSTIKNYRSDIQQYIGQSKIKEIKNLFEPDNIRSFVHEQLSSGLKTSTIKRKLSSISQYALWAENQKIVKDASFWITDIESLVSGNPAIHNYNKQLNKSKSAIKELEDYLLSLEIDGHSTATIKNYKSDITQFLSQSSKTKDLNTIITQDEIVKFVVAQRKSGLKVSSIKRKITSITQFALWAETRNTLFGVSSWIHNLPNQLFETKKVQAEAQKPKTAPELKLKPNNLVHAHQSGKNPVKHGWSLPVPSFTQENHAKDAGKESALEENRNVYSGIRSSLKEFANQINAKRNKQFLPFINLAMVILFAIGLGVLGYQQFIKQAPTPFAYPTTPTRPNRELSFQGRLTDTAQNPITTATNMAFRLYDNSSGGTQLWSSGTCSVTPDQDGIFNVGLGDTCGSEISQDVFSENSNVWLEVDIAAETLTPRQSIKTVAYALNSETVQGYPISATGAATTNTILTMDAGGQVLLGEVSPSLKATSGSFSIEAQALSLQTSSGSNGNITLSPNGTGTVIIQSDLDLEGYLHAPGATFSATYAGGSALIAKGGPTGTGNIQEWQNSAGTALSVVDASGNLGISSTAPGTTLDVVGTGRFSSTLTLSGAGAGTDNTVLLLNASNQVIQDEIDSRVWDTSLVDGSGVTNYVAKFSDADTLTTGVLFDDGTNVGIGSATPGYKLDVVGSLSADSINVNNAFTFPTTDGTTGYVLQTNGAGTISWASVLSDSPNVGAWTHGNHFLYPDEYWADDLVLGGNSSASATVQFKADGTGYFSGNVGIGSTTPGYALDVVGELNLTDAIRVAGDAGASGYLLTSSAGGAMTWTDPSTLSGGSSVWTKSGTNLSPTTTGDDVYLNSGELLGVGFNPTSITGGVAAFNGNVGIGTSSPSTKLNISDNTSETQLRLESTNATGKAYYRANAANSNVRATFGTDTTGGFFYMETNHPVYTFTQNDIYFSTGSLLNERMRITSAGNIGIGTSSPGAKLSVRNSSTEDILNLLDGSTEVFTVLDGGNVGVGTTAPSQKFEVYGPSSPRLAISASDSSNPVLQFNTGGNSMYWFFNGTDGFLRTDNENGHLRLQGGNATQGNVVIGGISTTPTSKLEIQGKDDQVQLEVVGNSTQTNNFFEVNSSGGSGGNRLVLNSAGNLGIGTTAPTSLFHLESAAPYMTWVDTANSGSTPVGRLTVGVDGGGKSNFTFWVGATTGNVITVGNERFSLGEDYVYLQASGDEDLYINANGNVGIGTISPARTLDIAGTGRFSGAVDFDADIELNSTLTDINNSVGNSGQLLSSTGAGVDWIDATSITTAGLFTNTLNVLHPKDALGSIADLTIGGTSTASAKIHLQSGGQAYFAGNVGIGTTAPIGLLNIKGAITGKALSVLQEMGDQDILTASNSAGATRFRMANTGNMYSELFSDISDSQYFLDPAATTTSLVVGGNVGIGTTAPDSLLDVYKDQDGSTLTKIQNYNVGTSAQAGLLIYNQNSAAAGGGILVGGTGFTTVSSWADSLVLASDSGLSGGVKIRSATGGIKLSASATEANDLFISTTGNIGIGTTNPTEALYVSGNGDIFAEDDITATDELRMLATGTAADPKLTWVNDDNTGLFLATTDTLGFTTAGSEAMRISSTGNVGIGTTNPILALHIATSSNPRILFQDTTSTEAWSAGLGTNLFQFTRTGTSGPEFQISTDGSSYTNAAITVGNNVHLNSGGISYINGGNVGIGTTNPGTYKLYINGTGYLAGAAAWVYGSDERLKENIAYFTDENISGLNIISKLKPTHFDYIQGAKNESGFIAQDIQKILPNLVTTNENGLLGLKTDGIIPYTVKAIQEQQEIINSNTLKTTSISLDEQSFILNSTAKNYTVSQANTTSPITSIAGFARAIISNITAGLINTRELIVETSAQIANLNVESLTIQGVPLPDYIAGVISGATSQTGAPLISPIDEDTVITIASDSGEIAFRNNSGKTVATIQENGDFSTLGTLLTNEIITTTVTATGSSRLGSLLVSQDATVSGSIFVTQDASISGTVIAEKIEATSSRIAALEAGVAQLEHVKSTTAEIVNATISGELHASTIYANNIYDFEDKIAQTLKKPNLLDVILGANEKENSNQIQDLYNTVNKSGFDASSSADLDLSFAELSMTSSEVTLTGTTLFVEKYFKVNGAGYIADSLGVGNSLLVGNSTQIADGLINYTTSDPDNQVLKIQPEGRGSIELLAGIVKIDESGKVVVNGDLDVTGNAKITGTLLTNLLKPTDFGNPFQVQVAGVDTQTNEVKKSRFEIINEVGTPVATFSAQGNAEFAGDVGVRGNLDVGGELKLNSQDLGSSDTNILNADKTSGKATIKSGADQVTIKSNLIKNDSLVYVTAVGSTDNKVLYVKSQTQDDTNTPENEGEFIVGFDSPTTKDVSFNWWIVN